MERDKEQDSNKHKEFIDDLIKEKPLTRSFQKLSRESVEVNVCRHRSASDAAENNLALLTEALNTADTDETKKFIQDKINSLSEEVKKLESGRIEGVLTYLTYRDVNDIKASVTEAVLHFKDYNFDPDVIMSRIIAEERFMTVFCALKKKDNPSQRYFRTLDEIALVDELSIFELYDLWERNFVLTDDELKN